MKFQNLAVLFLVAVLVNVGTAYFQRAPGYMDADYYFAGGLRLVQGHGFTEMVLWNYLDDPQSLPHPSHGYWFPLASIVAAGGMFLAGAQSFTAARLLFVLIAALAAPLTALLAYHMTGNNQNSLAAGFLMVFPGYYAVFLPTTDNFGILIVLGALFFLLVGHRGRWARLLLGVLAGLIHLARADGIIWAGLGLIMLAMNWRDDLRRGLIKNFVADASFFLTGYLVVMGPWMARNIAIWGTPFTAAGGRVLWLTGYEQTFSWPASQVNFQHWLSAGWGSFFGARWQAFILNAISAIGVQAAFLLFPCVLVGVWHLRRTLQIKMAVAGWILIFMLMIFVFPFAGSRGSFFHAGAAFQSIWFVCAVTGVEKMTSQARAKGWFTASAPQVFRIALVVCMVFITAGLVYVSVVQQDWNQFARTYQRVEQVLVENQALPEDVVMVSNSPGYYVSTGRAAINIPAENIESVKALAKKFGVRFLVLEKTYFTNMLNPVYVQPQNQPGLRYIREFDGVKVYQFLP